MELTLKRIARKANYTIGRLCIDDVYFCDTLEPTDRGLRQDLPVEVNRARKRKGNTAIPTGRYRLTLEVVSPRFSVKAVYKPIRGLLPRLINVPAFDGVLIHIGNTERDTQGCILVGRNKQVGMVTESKVTFFSLYDRLKEAKDSIYITIK